MTDVEGVDESINGLDDRRICDHPVCLDSQSNL